MWAVTNDRVVEGSLGYFITPLVSVVLGVMVVGERLRRAQWVAVALGVASVTWLTVDMGRLPWVSLFLAATFGIYGLIKKTVGRPPLDMLAIELTVMLPLVLVFLGTRLSGGNDALSQRRARSTWCSWAAACSRWCRCCASPEQSSECRCR